MNLFECPRHAGRLRLTNSTCGEMWLKARKTKPQHRLYPCSGCRIGAKNAGHDHEKTCRLEIDSLCVRCHRKTTRFIHKRWCVSCYNRGLEWLKGKNAKGTKPVFLPPLYTDELVIRTEGKPERVSVDRVASRLEAILSVARKQGGKTVFMWPGAMRRAALASDTNIQPERAGAS